MKSGTDMKRFMPEHLRYAGEVFFALEDALKGAKAGERQVAHALLAFEGRFPGSAEPAVATLAQFTGQGVRTVQKHLIRLQLRGVLEREANGGRTSTYRIVFPQKPDLGTPAESADLGPVATPPAKTADDLRRVVPALDHHEQIRAAAFAHVDPHTHEAGPGEGASVHPDQDRLLIRAIIREELAAFAAGERRTADPPPPPKPVIPPPVETPARQARDRVPPRPPPKPGPGLCGRKPPALSRELERALYALPGGRACGAMLSRRVPIAFHPWVASKVLEAAARLAKRGQKLENAEHMGLRIVRDDLDDHRRDLAERENAEDHDEPFDPDISFDPDTMLGPTPWGEPPPEIDTRTTGRPQPPPATTLRTRDTVPYTPRDRTKPSPFWDQVAMMADTFKTTKLPDRSPDEKAS